jgi:hypothetical protein
MYRPLTGDGAIIARVSDLGATDAWTKAGVISVDCQSDDSVAWTPGQRPIDEPEFVRLVPDVSAGGIDGKAIVRNSGPTGKVGADVEGCPSRGWRLSGCW